MRTAMRHGRTVLAYPLAGRKFKNHPDTMTLEGITYKRDNWDSVLGEVYYYPDRPKPATPEIDIVSFQLTQHILRVTIKTENAPDTIRFLGHTCYLKNAKGGFATYRPRA